MAGDRSWGEGCWFPEECGGGLQCLVEEDGACKLNCFYDLLFTIALLVTEGVCSLPAWVTGAVVGALDNFIPVCLIYLHQQQGSEFLCPFWSPEP